MNNIESYPPVLRHYLEHQGQPSPDPDEGGQDPIEDVPDPVPIIDLECLYNDSNKLDEVCKEWGVFRLVNHGVPLTLLKQLQEVSKQLFSLPFEAKEDACSGTPVKYFCGSASLTLSQRFLQNMNWFDGFHVPISQLSRLNTQHPMLESIRLLLMEYETHLIRIAKSVFEVMVKKLELNLEPSKPYLEENSGVVRVYRYPNCCGANVGWGLDAHTDSSVVTILNQEDEVSGLNVLKDDQWLTVKPISNTLIVNVGDMIQVLSDDRYKSVTHRVRIDKHKERISICYFVFPGEDVVIESSNYKPFTYKQYQALVEQDLKTTGSKVGLARLHHSHAS